MKALQSTEERMLVLVLISIVVLFVCCTTPAAVLSVLYSVKLDDHLGFQVARVWTFELLQSFHTASQYCHIIVKLNTCQGVCEIFSQVFRAVANNLELLNFALKANDNPVSHQAH